MDYFFFFMFQIITFNLEKNKSICKGKFLIHPIQVTGSTYCGIVFQTMYTPQRYVHKLAKNLKNSVCISVKNFGHL